MLRRNAAGARLVLGLVLAWSAWTGRRVFGSDVDEACAVAGMIAVVALASAVSNPPDEDTAFVIGRCALVVGGVLTGAAVVLWLLGHDGGVAERVRSAGQPSALLAAFGAVVAGVINLHRGVLSRLM